MAESAGVRRPYAGRRVLLGVTGGIAAYKAIQVARDLTQAGAEVDVVLTSGALEFIQPLSFEALTGRRAHTTAHVSGDPLSHIRLARDADLILVAPATANFLARAAAGMADDLLTAVLLATDAPVVVCPAMNDQMYAHPQTQANLERLQRLGYGVAGPAVGPLAWGEGEGPGRMLESDVILSHTARALEGRTPYSGLDVVVTAGPTREPIDPVRFIGNRSSGRMGYALAAAAWRRGASVTLITGPTQLALPTGVSVVQVKTAGEMKDAVAEALPRADALVMAAAVADFRPARPHSQKLKKESGSFDAIELERTDDVLQATRSLRPASCVVVGFALETESALANGLRKLESKGLDLLVLNDANEPGAGFENSTNRVTLLQPGEASIELPLLDKREVADRILDAMTPLLDRKRAAR